MNTKEQEPRLEFFHFLQIVLGYVNMHAGCVWFVPQNEMLKSTVITDTKFYFPSFFEKNQQQKDGVKEEAFRHTAAIYSGRVGSTNEVTFDFLPSRANIDVVRTQLSVAASTRGRSRVAREKKTLA